MNVCVIDRPVMLAALRVILSVVNRVSLVQFGRKEMFIFEFIDSHGINWVKDE